MKQTWKKIIGLILISVCILAMTACGKNSSEETSSLTMPDEASQQSLIESFGTVLQNISQLDEASIKSYMAMMHLVHRQLLLGIPAVLL